MSSLALAYFGHSLSFSQLFYRYWYFPFYNIPGPCSLLCSPKRVCLSVEDILVKADDVGRREDQVKVLERFSEEEALRNRQLARVQSAPPLLFPCEP